MTSWYKSSPNSCLVDWWQEWPHYATAPCSHTLPCIHSSHMTLGMAVTLGMATCLALAYGTTANIIEAETWKALVHWGLANLLTGEQAQICLKDDELHYYPVVWNCRFYCFSSMMRLTDQETIAMEKINCYRFQEKGGCHALGWGKWGKPRVS